MTRRVLHVYKHFRPTFTGEGVFLERLVPVMAELRPDVAHEVLVTTTTPPSEAPSLAGIAATHYLARPEAGASQRDIVRWLARNAKRYDVVHHHTHVDRTFLGALQLKLKGRRIVLSATLDDSLQGLLRGYRPAFRPLVRRLFGLVDQFVAISPRLHDENLQVAPAGKSALVPIGIHIPPERDESAAARERLGLRVDAKVLVCVGGLCRRKDQLFLIEQLPELVRSTPELTLVLVGPDVENHYRSLLQQRVDELGLADHVVFAGHSDEPWDYYRAADVMVFASRQEGFGTVVIEAMAHGLPIVARRLPGVNDTFVGHGVSGYLYDDADEYGSFVAGLVADPVRARAMGRSGRAFVAARYHIEDIATRYLELYGFAPKRRAAAAPLRASVSPAPYTSAEVSAAGLIVRAP